MPNAKSSSSDDKGFLFGLLLAFVLCASGPVSALDYPIPIHRGNGLANVFAKLNGGQSVKIAYIGGSVTEGWGWRDLVTQWFNNRYPGKITEINAGWSGTGSLIGAMRFNRNVLAHNPDLVFIEFAVNDLPEDPIDFVRKNCEGMARQAWQQNPYMDICFIETIAWYSEGPYLSGYYPTPVQAHYDVCDFYGISSVNVGWALYEYVLAGTSWESLTINGDRCHPNAAGSQMYADAVNSYLESERTRGGAWTPHSLGAAMTTFPVTSSTITDWLSVSPLPGGWSARYNEFGVASFIQSTTPGSQVSIGFTGPSAAVKIVVSSDSGDVQYSVDGGGFAPANVTNNGWTYLWAFPVAKNLSTGSHTLTVRVTSGTARLINTEAAVSTVSAIMNGNTPTGAKLSAAAWQTDSDYSADFNGAKALDGSTSTKWASLGTAPPHWLTVDLGVSLTVNGYILRNASTGGEPTYYNTEYFSFQTGTSMSGPWTDDAVVNNSAQAGVITRSYNTPKSVRYVRLYITDPGIDNYTRIPEFEVWGEPGSNPPTISLNKSSLSPSCTQGGSPANDSFTVQNTGGSTLSYSISDNVTWLSCNPTSGTSTGEADTITVSYATASLPVGSYGATITVSDPNATNNPRTIAVSLTVNAPPATIALNPTSLTPFANEGSNPPDDTFTVQNTGGGTLSYSISDDANWLSCSPATGTGTGEQDTITVTYATSSLAAGTYNATITVSDPNATNNPQAIPVSLTVTALSPSPVLIAAVSRKTHTGAGNWDINVGAGDIESRSVQLGTANPSELLIIATFDIDIGLLGNGDEVVSTDVGTIADAYQTDMRELTVLITNLPLAAQVNLTFPGVVDGWSLDPNTVSDSTLCVRLIVGDYDDLGRTNFLDFAKIKSASYINAVPNTADMARGDFDCTGRINFLDFAKVKNAGLINQTASACTTPIGP